MPHTGLLTTRQILFRVFLVMLSVEAAIMLLVAPLQIDNPLLAAGLDVLLLGLIATPAIYRWVVKPFVTDRDRALEASARLALTDPLTRLANRRHFRETLAMEHGRHVRSGASLALLLIDVDHFKQYNDSFGHLKGDECLQRVAAEIARCASRPADLVARYGGEEFIVVLPETDLKGATVIGEEIRRGIEALAVAHVAPASDSVLTVSVGATAGPCSRSSSAMALVARADELLYQAKSAGRNRVEAGPHDRQATDFGVPTRELGGGYRSGNAHIDAQHLEILRDADRLLLALAGPGNAAGFEQQAIELLRRVAVHFRDEVDILRDLGFPGVDAHAREHTRLLEKAARQLRDFQAGKIAACALFQFLARELVFEHVLLADSEFFAFTSADAHTDTVDRPPPEGKAPA